MTTLIITALSIITWHDGAQHNNAQHCDTQHNTSLYQELPFSAMPSII
jgi:hypothetical protein